MKRYFALLLFLTACEGFFGPAPTPQPAPVLTVTPSVTEGDAPLSVTFAATLENATSQTFRWTVGTEVQAETTDTFSTVFETPGTYIVSAEGAGAADSVSVTVRGEPVVEPIPDTLNLSATPGGPAPWAVRYTLIPDPVTPAGDSLEARCREGAAFRRVEGSVFACVHEPGDTVQARYLTPSGEVAVAAETTPEITQTSGVAFAGSWRYSARNKTETFAISEGDETAGSSADGRFKIFTLRQREGTIVEFTIDGGTVVLTPTPDDDGRQLYRGEVYDLTLEPLPAEGTVMHR